MDIPSFLLYMICLLWLVGELLVKCFNSVSFQYVLLTIACWDLLTPKEESVITSRQHTILFIVQIKDCAKSSLQMKCSQTFQHYFRFYLKMNPSIYSFYTGLQLAYTTICTIKPNYKTVLASWSQTCISLLSSSVLITVVSFEAHSQVVSGDLNT